MRAALAALVLLAGLGVTSCDSERRAISRDDLPEVPVDATVEVTVGADGFDQAELEVTTADLVEFRNVDVEEHGVRTADHEIDSGPLLPDEFTLILFDTPGRYTLFDTEDDDSTMTVVVSP
ncbi:cupredoxin domain-containing protein [Actinospongicola halichondriae]|uniref:cupredoxin domain-containing protein n=1 Tax=Actinospongicola halichondriae TaxID=3236844 RepID=UPI003D586A0F